MEPGDLGRRFDRLSPEGKSYTQALVDGELLLLRVGTGLFQYHAAGDGPFAYCASPSSAYSVTADG